MNEWMNVWTLVQASVILANNFIQIGYYFPRKWISPPFIYFASSLDFVVVVVVLDVINDVADLNLGANIAANSVYYMWQMDVILFERRDKIARGSTALRNASPAPYVLMMMI